MNNSGCRYCVCTFWYMVHFQSYFFFSSGKEVWNASTQLWLSENVTLAVVLPSGFSGATSLPSPKLSSPLFLTGSRTRLKETAGNFIIYDFSLALLWGWGLHPLLFSTELPTLLSLRTAHSMQGSRMSRQENQNEPVLRIPMNAPGDLCLQLVVAP